MKLPVGMPVRVTTAAAVAAFAAATLVTIVPISAGGDRVAFPADYGKGVKYDTFDNDRTKTFGEVYTSAAALEAAKKGAPLPDGTVITLVSYAVKKDAQGNPEKDASGHFIKTDTIAGYGVMEKRAGWGAAYPENVRNGDWEYQAFKADKTVNTAAKLDACFSCHKPQDKLDFVYTYDKMKTAGK